LFIIEAGAVYSSAELSDFLIYLVKVCKKVVHTLYELSILAVDLSLDVLPEIIDGIE
jgi:hypothetical protein